MDKIFYRRIVGWSTTFTLFILFAFGCGSSRQTSTPQAEEVNLDDLLGQEASSSDQSSEEDEVLRLLGITPAEEPQQSELTTTAVEGQGELEQQVSELQNELERKDMEISQLRAELTMKESTISDLEKQKRSPGPVGGSGSARPSAEFQARYQSALSLFNNRDYTGAMSAFQDLLLTDANNTLSDNCQYWIGECYYGMKNFNQAITEFEKVFSFANSNKSDDAQLKLGICHLKLGDSQQARAEFERLLSNYPSSEYTSLAERYLARI